MPTPQQEYWWLIGLEATLFFSLPCWEATAPWSWPAANPFQFAALVIGAATIATLTCHIGPAICAAGFGARPNLPWWIPAIWLTFGYLEWLGTMVRTMAPFAMFPRMLIEPTYILTILAAITALAWTRLWKYSAIATLIFSIGYLIWILELSWPGLWIQNPHFPPMPNDGASFDWLVIKGMLLSAAPAVLIAWRIGQMEERKSRIWLSGLLGLAIPLALSVTLASLATMAGLRAHYRPSFLRNFEWATNSGFRIYGNIVIRMLILTFLGPTLVSAFSLNQLIPPLLRKRAWLLAILIPPLSYALSFLQLRWHQNFAPLFVSVPHEIWSWSLIFLGATAGAATILFWRTELA